MGVIPFSAVFSATFALFASQYGDRLSPTISPNAVVISPIIFPSASVTISNGFGVDRWLA